MERIFPGMKILLIEDEPLITRSIVEFLTRSGAVVESAATLADGLLKSAVNPYDCVLIDIMLPDGSGLDVIRQLKRDTNDAGIVIISARNSLDDKVKGLSLGADDYLAKPFQLPELGARVQAVVRRRQHRGQPVISFRNLSIDTAACEVKVGESPVSLTRKEYDLLLFLVANRDRVVSKEAIAEHLWGDYIIDADAFDFIYAHVKNLRKKLMQAGGGDYITTVHGIGYRLDS